MSGRQNEPRPILLAILLFLTFTLTLIARVWDIDSRFWLLRDQIRDWRIALRPFSELPLVGPATHVGGYTIGPAFYWILWALRITFGPWFDNLPHGGGIGQAVLGSAADVLLFVAVWRRTHSAWASVAAITLLSTAAFDLCLAAVIWNPIMGATLASFATAMMLLGWHRTTGGAALIVALAWSAVHAYTGAIYVAVSTFFALLVEPLVHRDTKTLVHRALTIAAVVGALQVPYAVYQFTEGFRNSAMGAVSDSVGRILSGQESPRILASTEGYADAFNFIEGGPWRLPFAWGLVPCALLLLRRYRRDVTLLSMTLLPQLMAIAGYSLFLGALDHYYYFSLMPAAILTLVMGATAVPSPRAGRAIAVVVCVLSLAIVPARIRYSTTMHHLPEYGPLVKGSRIMAQRKQPMRAIETEFTLPRTADREVLYEMLGGRLDPAAPWVGVISRNGDVSYRRADGS